MIRRTKTIASTWVTLTLGLAWAAVAQPAEARWTFHDDSVGETITAPPGGTRAHTCTDRLRAVGGWGKYIDVSAGEDPAAFQIPPRAKTAVSYEVWKAPPGFSSFNLALEDESGVYFERPDGTRQPAVTVGRATTRPRVALKTPVPSNGDPKVSDNFVFTTAGISIPLRGVASGDRLGLRPTGHQGGIFVNVTAMDCTRPVVKAKVDVLPGAQVNVVRPKSEDDLVPVRIFGSRSLDVRKIAEVRLGEAAPVSPPAQLQPSLRPRDTNRDGRLDRLYYFRQGDTRMMCIDKDVKVTGRTTDKKRFQASDRITTAGCAA